MVRRWRVLLMLGVAALLPLMAGCGGGGEPAQRDESEEPPRAASTAEVPADDEEGVVAESGGFSPLGFLTGSLPGLGGDLSSLSMDADVDPALKAVLLRQGDLPGGFASLGSSEFAFSVPVEGQPVDMAMSMFFSGDPSTAGGDFAAVMSAAAAVPPGMLEQSFADFPSGDDAHEELEEALGQAGDVAGLDLLDVEVLDASGLGEEGVGLHMAIDFGGLMEGIAGAEAAAEAGPTRINFDMYTFTRGGRLLMLMVMWPGDQPPPVDAIELAVVIDERALAAF